MLTCGKYGYIIFAIIYCLLFTLGCTPIIKDDDYILIFGNNKFPLITDNMIDFRITIVSNEQDTLLHNVLFEVINISEEYIRLAAPTCLGYNIMPILTDSAGERISQRYTMPTSWKVKYLELKPHELYDTAFIYPIEEYFMMPNTGKFCLWFEYYGNIMNIETKAFVRFKVESNIIVFTKNNGG